jgi:succinoglycan biosynthesis transport protein ExoP
LELKQIFPILRRWWWLLVLGLVLGAGAALLASWYQTPIYQASTQVMVMRAPQERASDATYLNDQQLTQTYIQLIGTRQVINSVSAQMGITVKSSQIRVQQVSTTQVIKIFVEDANPAQAAAIANILVDVLIDANDNLQTGRFTSADESLQAQITQIQTQINDLQTQINDASAQGVQEQLTQVDTEMTSIQAEIASLQTEITSLTDPGQQDLLLQKQTRLDQLQSILALYQGVYSNLVVIGKPASGNAADRVTQLQKTLELYQQIYLQLLSNLEDVRLARLQSTPNVVQIDLATIPGDPIRPTPLKNTLLGGAVGLMLAGGIVFLIEYLDDTFKSPAQVEERLHLPVIGYIAEISRQEMSLPGLFVARQPRAPVAEAFRSLRTNLEFTQVDNPIRTILVTSAEPGDGKTVVSANLSAIIAQGGQQVTLVDADLRRPSIHRLLQATNPLGLTDLFRDRLEVKVVGRNYKNVKGLKVVTSGTLPPNPTELLASDRMGKILTSLVDAADIVIIDSPPAIVADVQVLAARVDGVLLVIRPGKTHIDAALATVEQLRRTGARLIGVVLNRISRHSGHYYGNYRYSNYSYKNGLDKTRLHESEQIISGRSEPAAQLMLTKVLPESEVLEKPLVGDDWPNKPLLVKKKDATDE